MTSHFPCCLIIPVALGGIGVPSPGWINQCDLNQSKERLDWEKHIYCLWWGPTWFLLCGHHFRSPSPLIAPQVPAQRLPLHPPLLGETLWADPNWQGPHQSRYGGEKRTAFLHLSHRLREETPIWYVNTLRPCGGSGKTEILPNNALFRYLAPLFSSNWTSNMTFSFVSLVF